VNPHPGLFWPSHRTLFRRRQGTAARIALWLALAALLALAAAGYLQLP
jgi:hypothetical protein